MMAALSALRSFQVQTTLLTPRTSLPRRQWQGTSPAALSLDPSPFTVSKLDCSNKARKPSPPVAGIRRWLEGVTGGEQGANVAVKAAERDTNEEGCDSAASRRVVLRSSVAAVLALAFAGSMAGNDSFVQARPVPAYILADAKVAAPKSSTPPGQVGAGSPVKNFVSLGLTSIGAIIFSVLWIAELQHSSNMKADLATAEAEGKQMDTRLAALRATMREETSAMEERVQREGSSEPEAMKQLMARGQAQDVTSEALTKELQSYSNVIPALRQQVTLLESELAGTSAERTAIASRLAEAETKERALVEYAGLADRRVRELERMVGIKQREISAQRRDMSAMQERMEQYRQEIAALEEAKTSLSQEQPRRQQGVGRATTGASKEQSEAERWQLAAVQAELEEVAKSLEKTSAEVEECKRALAAKDSSLRSFETQAAQKSEELSRLGREVERLKGERRELEYLKTRVEELTSELMRSRNAAASLRS
eukprot:TRINITY_DN4414_c0_g1_i2.p1 TRINITY_DN4414_c0_g1~~TRINITY_DN4414_c0_g1_i2.p1  ORF type:complete len:483 (+),score=103.98 TRINITY_DN4414_c0_g1_i2:230-1678(+)